RSLDAAIWGCELARRDGRRGRHADHRPGMSHSRSPRRLTAGTDAMKRTLVITFAVVAGIALAAALVYAVLAAVGLAQPGAAVSGLTARRLWATLVAMLAVAGVATGALALRRPGHHLATPRGARLAATLGLIGMINGAANLAVATGGPGTGNGVVGAAAAVVLGAVAVALGGLALARGRRLGMGAGETSSPT